MSHKEMCLKTLNERMQKYYSTASEYALNAATGPEEEKEPNLQKARIEKAKYDTMRIACEIVAANI